MAFYAGFASLDFGQFVRVEQKYFDAGWLAEVDIILVEGEGTDLDL